MTTATGAGPLNVLGGVADIDLDHGVPAFAGDPGFVQVRVLVRRGGHPVAQTDVWVPPQGLTPDEVTRALDECGLRAGAAEAPRRRAGGPGLAVVVATRDRPDSLRRCLESLQAQILAPVQVVVVDNASVDLSTRSVVAELAATDPRVLYVREDRPGLACAHNAALAHLHAPLVAFVDDDVVVDTWWAERIVAGFHAADGVACVTGLILPAELRTAEQWWVERSAGFGKGFDRVVVDPAVEVHRDPLFPFAVGRYGSGANMAFRVDVLRSLGGFDPPLGAGSPALGGDDLAAFHAVVTAGHKLVYEPGAVVFHHHHRSYPALRRQVHGYGAGLTAYLTSVVLARPSVVPLLVRRAWDGARHALVPSSPRMRRRPAAFPELTRVEWAGMATGPVRYLRSRAARRHARPEVSAITDEGHP